MNERDLMRAARYYGNGDIRIEEIPEPVVGAGEVGVKVAWCGICGTDLHEYEDGPIFCPTPDGPHPISGESAPITLGHEMSGVVYELGEGVDDLEVGQHVVVEPYIIAEHVDTSESNDAYHLSVTGKIGLDDLIDKGFDTLLHHNETAVKILVSPSGSGLDQDTARQGRDGHIRQPAIQVAPPVGADSDRLGQTA